jgi:hypothetical protein
MKRRLKKVARNTADTVRGKTSAKRHDIRIGKPDPETARRIAAHEVVARFCDKSLSKLIELARVPKARRDAFWWDLGDVLLDFLLTQANIHANLELLKNASFARAVGALKSARQALAQIDDAPREAFRGWISIAEEGVEEFLASVGELELKRPRRRGKPPGKFRDPVAHKIVFRLVECAVFHGGKLTFDKNIKEGTLMEALGELAPYLPEGVHPDKLSPPTLQRIKDAASKAAWEKQELLDQKFDNF